MLVSCSMNSANNYDDACCCYKPANERRDRKLACFFGIQFEWSNIDYRLHRGETEALIGQQANTSKGEDES